MFSGSDDLDDINNYVPSLLNPRRIKKTSGNASLTQNSILSRCSLSLNRYNSKPSNLKISQDKKIRQNFNHIDKENSLNLPNVIKDTKHIANIQSSIKKPQQSNKKIPLNVESKSVSKFSNYKIPVTGNLSFLTNKTESSSLDIEAIKLITKSTSKETNKDLRTVSSVSELNKLVSSKSNIKLNESANNNSDKPTISVSFGINGCESVDVNSKDSVIKRVVVSHNDDNTIVECEIVESSQISTDYELDENMNETAPCMQKEVAVNIEIKKPMTTHDTVEDTRVLILKTNAIDKLTHVIVQPPNYRLVKRKKSDKTKSRDSKRKAFDSTVNNGKLECSDKLKQISIDSFFHKVADVKNFGGSNKNGNENVVQHVDTMSKNSGVVDAVKLERIGKSLRNNRKDNDSPRSARLTSAKTESYSPRRQDIKISSSEAPRVPSSRCKNDSTSSHSPRKNFESIQFNITGKSKSSKAPISPKCVPNYKIVAGTHFAVDAFSYGDIPNVKHYFLTHFHSDHYSGLKKGFNKLLFCSKITADLCTSRLGVNPKCIHVINVDETVRIEGVEVTAVDANHCPGAIMLVFTLPNGKTLLHTGDFRSSPTMESYPVFWNKEIHTVYLDTTYCNPRYDFPTQDQSLEMALYILRQKKLNLEKIGKKFSSVLIVCGTYTIGKEKFFLGMARRVGCSVWACPEKDRVLQTVEGRSFSHAPPQSCQLHVVPMRDLTHEKLRSYMDSLQGAFSEVVAFKPSGWENGKNSGVERDLVTIHGIPYSEHSSFSELIRFVKFLKPKQVVPTVDITGGVKAVQKYFPCPLVYKEDLHSQSKVTDFFSIYSRQQVPAVT